MVVAAREAQVVERHVVDREHGAGGPVLGGHVADGGPVGERYRGHARPEELHELADHADLAQDVGDGEHQVGGGGPGRLLARQAEAHHRREEERKGLSEHGRLGLDAAHTPAEDPEAVDHGGVGVGAHQRVAVGAAVVGGEDHPRQVLEIDLVADAHARGHDPEAVEGLLGPAQQLVALDVAVVLDVDVLVVRRAVPEASAMTEWSTTISTGTRGLILAGSPPSSDSASRMAARSTTPGYSGQVLHEDPFRGQGDFGGIGSAHTVALRIDAPGGHRLDVGCGDGQAVLVAQQVLQDDLDGVRQAGHVEAVGEGPDPEDLVGGVADRQVATGTEGVGGGGGVGHTPILPRHGAV